MRGEWALARRRWKRRGDALLHLSASSPFVPARRSDVGWDETYQQYFDGTGPIKGRNVSKILTNVIAGLKRNATRKFTYCEQAFFAKWYETQTPGMQDDVKNLVATGQLVFINGGWSM